MFQVEVRAVRRPGGGGSVVRKRIAVRPLAGLWAGVEVGGGPGRQRCGPEGIQSCHSAVRCH